MTNTQRLRILLVGAGGTLGRAVAAELGSRHDVIKAGRNSGDVRLDMSDPASIERALAKIGELDAVACAAGSVAFLPLGQIQPAAIEESAYGLGLRDKLMGQVNLALAARKYLRDRGSITLISGVTADEPIAAGSSATMVNCALEGFVRAAAIELPRGLRINLVSPGLLLESVAEFGAFFRGFEPVPAARAARAYARSIEGLQTGQVYRVA